MWTIVLMGVTAVVVWFVENRRCKNVGIEMTTAMMLVWTQAVRCGLEERDWTHEDAQLLAGTVKDQVMDTMINEMPGLMMIARAHRLREESE